MRVRLLAFGPLQSLLPAGGVERELPPGATVASLLDLLRGEALLAPEALRSAAIAVNQEYAPASHLLADGDEVAILPPVSGGAPPVSGGSEGVVALVRGPIDAAAIQQALKSPADGALCIFDGIVRGNTRGRPTLHLDYHAYEAMALRQMQRLREEALARYAVRDLALVHRLGRLLVGETSVYIAVASPHRGPAFDACRFVIDTLKKTVPIWKMEQFVDGALWADGEPFPPDIVAPPLAGPTS